jgi:hypothetical protein
MIWAELFKDAIACRIQLLKVWTRRFVQTDLDCLNKPRSNQKQDIRKAAFSVLCIDIL